MIRARAAAHRGLEHHGEAPALVFGPGLVRVREDASVEDEVSAIPQNLAHERGHVRDRLARAERVDAPLELAAHARPAVAVRPRSARLRESRLWCCDRSRVASASLDGVRTIQSRDRGVAARDRGVVARDRGIAPHASRPSATRRPLSRVRPRGGRASSRSGAHGGKLAARERALAMAAQATTTTLAKCIPSLVRTRRSLDRFRQILQTRAASSRRGPVTFIASTHVRAASSRLWIR